jgi:hypothetical protein
MLGSLGHGNETQYCVNDGTFLSQMSNYYLFSKDPAPRSLWETTIAVYLQLGDL